MKYKKYLDVLYLIIVFCIMILVITHVPIISSYNKNNGKLIINEIVPKNKNTLELEGNYYDVIELYNGYDYDINLEGYHISDDNLNLKKYTFPNVVIKANSYLLIYTSGLNKYEDNIIHTNFKLNNNGEVITLTDKNIHVLSKIYYKEMISDISYGYNGEKYVYYYVPTLGIKNTGTYSEGPIDIIPEFENNEPILKDIRINEVEEVNSEWVELKNLTDKDISLIGYIIKDKSEVITKLDNYEIKANSYLVLTSDELGFNINNSNEEIYLYKDDILVDKYSVGKLIKGVSSGINEGGQRVFYKTPTPNKENTNTYYLGYSNKVIFSTNTLYVDKNTKIELSTNDNSTIYYTLDGSFPNKNSNIYTEPINITKDTIIKAISYKENFLGSDINSRTYIIDRKHDLPVVSITSDNDNLYGNSGIISNYEQNSTRMISFEYYDDKNLAVCFVGDTKLAGMDSREQPQKSMTVYLRKSYGISEITYPFFNEQKTYSSILLRNAGEDPKRIRIMDAVLTRNLKNQMDIDMQDYRPVVVYINGKYNGLYELREKLNGDYIETNYGIDKEEIDLIKYKKATKGTIDEYNKLLDYIYNHDPKEKEVYEYLKTQIDIQELINYVIVEAYYGNTDLGNIRYWKASSGKWRWMLYDLDWSMWDSNINMSYPVIDTRIPAVTRLFSVYDITRKLYRNNEFKKLYLETLSYHLKNTFIPERMNNIVDNLSSEIKNEMIYHIERWPEYNLTIDKWYNNLESFKSMIRTRYNNVLKNIKEEFDLTEEEYKKYFGDIYEK